jgi:AraC-like DNA-binding protein
MNNYPMPSVNDFSIRMFNGARAVYGPDWGGKGINDNFSRLYLLKSGKGRVEYANKTEFLEPGRMYIFPAGLTADYYCDLPMELCWLHFRWELVPGISYFGMIGKALCRPLKTNEVEIFEDLLSNLENCGMPDTVLKYSKLLVLLSPFMETSNEYMMTDDAIRLKPALEELKSNPARRFDLKVLAGRVALHPTYFSNLFKKTYGISPGRYHLEQRLLLAKNLLRKTKLTLAEISEECGYNDEFFFARTFKKYIGTSPGRYRKQRFKI